MDKHTPSGLKARALREIIDGIERRRERRKQARDVVYLVVGPRPQLVVAKLADLSDGGFRAVHHHLRLAAGEAIQYFLPSNSGTALVVWSRIFNGVVESGFQILDKEQEKPGPGAKLS